MKEEGRASFHEVNQNMRKKNSSKKEMERGKYLDRKGRRGEERRLLT